MRLGGMFFIHPSSLSPRKRDQAKSSLDSLDIIHNVRLPSDEAPDGYPSGNHGRTVLYERCSMYYSIALFVGGLAFGGASCYSFYMGVKDLQLGYRDLSKIVTDAAYLIFVLQLLISHFIFLSNSMDESRMYQFFVNSWEYLRYVCPIANCSYWDFAATFRWRRNAVCLITVIHCLVQLASNNLPLLIPDSPSHNFTELRENVMKGYESPEKPAHFAMTALMCFGGLYTSVIFIVPCYCFQLIAILIMLEFRHLNHDFAASVRVEDGVLTVKTLEWFRIRHNSLCILLDAADELFAPWIAMTLVMDMIQILFGIFITVARRGDMLPLTTVAQVYWILTFFLQVTMTLYRGALVNEAAHEPLLRLFQINQAKVTVPESMQIQTFLNRLTGAPIGFTGWKMFTINWETLLMVFGTYITYQLLLFQFRMDLSYAVKPDNVTSGATT